MRKTIYTTFGTEAKNRAFKLYESINESYRKQYKRNPPDMFVGIQTILERGSDNNWILTVDGSEEEVDRVENLAKMVKV